ncbi:hypothetical protein Droror1_Dr00014551 [Drosera rotundifolia]
MGSLMHCIIFVTELQVAQEYCGIIGQPRLYSLASASNSGFHAEVIQDKVIKDAFVCNTDKHRFDSLELHHFGKKLGMRFSTPEGQVNASLWPGGREEEDL